MMSPVSERLLTTKIKCNPAFVKREGIYSDFFFHAGRRRFPVIASTASLCDEKMSARIIGPDESSK